MTTANECPRPRTLTASKRLSIKTSTKRVQNATEELQKYIEQFTDAELPEQTNPTATPIARCYGSSNVTLLSTKPKSFSSPKKHSRKAAISPEKQGKMVDNLVQWVNESYSKDLQRKIVPFGQRSNSSVDINSLSQTDGNGESYGDEVSTISDGDVQLSTLPSPGSSVASDLDSNVGSMSTDMLVSSFYRHNNSQQSQGKAMSHPSWVEELVTAKHYPSWVDDIDESRAHDRDVRRNQRNRLSRSLSPSFFREHPPLSPTPLSPLSTSLQDHPMEISDPHQKKSKAWDLESTDTEVLIGESIYGRQPVNMGGAFHSSLYRDKKIQQLHDHSVRKFAKDSERSLVKEMSFAQSHVDDRKTSGHPTQRFTKPTKMSNSKTSISKHTKKKAGPLMKTSKSFPHDRGTKNVSENPNFQPRSFSKNVYTSTNRPSSLNLPNNIKSSSEIRKNSTDSSNTDRLMRKSPTGIQMAKQDAGSRNIENPTRKSRRSNKDDRISTQIPSPRVRPTPNMLYSSKDFRTPDIKVASRGTPNAPHSAKNVRTFNVDISPRQNASDELQRIIDQADSSEPLRQRKDHYLDGKVSKKDLTLQDRKQIFNNDRIHASKVSHTIRTEPNNNYSTKGFLHPTRTDPRHFSQRRLVPSGKYHRRTAWNENSSFGNHSESYERSSPRTKIPRNSDPTKLDLGTKIRDHKLRSRTKSAPNMKDGYLESSSPERRDGYRSSLKTRVTRRDVNYANKGNILAAAYSNDGRISDADYANEDVMLMHDDTVSVDTEALIIKPPMPLFDASPSLTTESAETTEDSEESGDTLIENLALRTSFLDLATDPSSGTSYLELSPQRDIGLDWEDEKPPNARFNTKPGIITSFLEDCMRNSESRSDMKSDTGKFPSRSFIEEEPESVMSEDISSERPVETLKKMLFTVQRLTHSSEENSDQGVDGHSALETQSERLTEEVLSDILSTASRNEGQDSLSRAYYHLARLKRLVSASKEVAAWK